MPSACEACRSMKMRCSKSAETERTIDLQAPCDRCRRQNRRCRVLPPRPPGRKPGALGRYRGVDKALRKIEAELRKAKSSQTDAQFLQTSVELEARKDKIFDLLFFRGDSPSANDPTNQVVEQPSIVPEREPKDPVCVVDDFGPSIPMASSPHGHHSPCEGDNRISNPLGLLADVCGETEMAEPPLVQIISPSSNNDSSVHIPECPPLSQDSTGLAHQLLSKPGHIALGVQTPRQSLEQGLTVLLTSEGQTCRYPDYFRSSQGDQERDTGPDLDPIDLGLVSMEDANYLFPIFFSRLHVFNGILDPLLHTPMFVRQRSSLLFTWIMAISAQFDHSSGLLAKRLRLHGERLSRHVHSHGLKSVEIVQGYYISLLSATPASTLAQERSWLYTIHAFGVASELSLDSRSRSLTSLRDLDFGTSTSGDSRSTTAAHPEAPTGQEDIAMQQDSYCERLARNRERTWLRILLWERAHSAARGRTSTFPETELTQNIESWYLHPLANEFTDKYTCAFILFRRHLAALHTKLRREMEGQQLSPHWARELLDSALEPWCTAWLKRVDAVSSTAEIPGRASIHYVYMHGRLSTLSFALYSQTTRGHDVSGIREDCFHAAVSCCETMVRDMQEIGEPLFCMLAPTWAMISYAAVLALRLFPMIYGEQPKKAVELLALLGQVAIQLKRAGTTPSHRFGIAAHLGEHLLRLLRLRAARLQAVDPSNASLAHDCVQPTHEGRGVLAEPVSHGQMTEPLLNAYDPFLTGPFLPFGETIMTDEFSETMWQWLE